MIAYVSVLILKLQKKKKKTKLNVQCAKLQLFDNFRHVIDDLGFAQADLDFALHHRSLSFSVMRIIANDSEGLIALMTVNHAEQSSNVFHVCQYYRYMQAMMPLSVSLQFVLE